MVDVRVNSRPTTHGLSTTPFVKPLVRWAIGKRLNFYQSFYQSAQRNHASTYYGVVDRQWVVGHDFEAHAHHKNAFSNKSEFRQVNNLKNTSGSPLIGTTCW